MATGLGAVLLGAAATMPVVPASAGAPLPDTCGAEGCDLQASVAGYTPPVATLDSGTVVRWRASDAPHPTGEAFPSGDPCFVVPVGPGVGPVPVRFDVVDGAVSATVDPGAPSATTATCTGATAVGDGVHVLEYRCFLHPWMFGSLVIEAPAT